MKIIDIIKKLWKENIDYDQLKSNLEKIAPSKEGLENLIDILDFVYYLGMDDGEAGGYKNALSDNSLSDNEREQIYDDAREDMESDLNNKWDEGHSEGHSEGYKEGYEDAKNECVDEGHSEGYDEGHTTGYEEGYEDAKNECVG